ncbi:MAG: phenylacetate-CoA oxygenase/reductase subunit PaaK, partial [Gloeobacteraceae cyanobacterium ES-bin-316]|nr:phenylacetate-CoA oxygenase/reductase subunit PaaK [Ferruginibacter sp.]
HFHPLKIKEVKRETTDCVSVCFEIPTHLKQEFIYKEGQNITIKTTLDGQDLRRSYSLCTAPHEQEIKVAIKKVQAGLFSQFANEILQKGDVLEVLPPTGKFNAKISTTQAAHYLAVAAGSGITPVISIIKHTLQSQPDTHFTLVYGNKSRSSIIFFEELEGLKNKYMHRFKLINILSRERTDATINYGRIDKDKLASMQHMLSFKTFDSIYLCGPEQMIFEASDYFQSLGIEKSKIHFELFTTPGQGHAKKEILLADTKTDIGPNSSITVKLDGRSFDFSLGHRDKSILDAALEQGADLPYACKGGVCCTCRAKLVSGEVVMDVNYALEPEEVEQGFILTCQSHPRSSNVVIDFDIK